MQPRINIMKLGSKPLAVAQHSKINFRDVSNFENIPDVFRGCLTEMKIRFHLYTVIFIPFLKKIKISNRFCHIFFPDFKVVVACEF